MPVSRPIAQLRPAGEVVNVDEVAKSLDVPTAERNLKAARLALQRIDFLLGAGIAFNFETTLSSNQALQVMAKARAIGYRVELVYIILVHQICMSGVPEPRCCSMP